MKGINTGFWQGKRVLVTGHTGFKGSWLSIWLRELGAEVFGYALAPQTEADNYILCGLEHQIPEVRGDLRNTALLEQAVQRYHPDIIFHLAAQPLVRRSYIEPQLTYETNLMGSLNVLEAARKADCVRAAVMITTDKCYENRGSTQGYRETDPMGGYDPYSSSKGCAELMIASYRRSFCQHEGTGKCTMAVASARAGNVVGGGDWSEDRLIPDCIRAIEAGKPVCLRNPAAVRPWQFVLEPLRGYLMLAEALWNEPEKRVGGWNFGPDPAQMASVREMARELISHYGEGKIECHAETDCLHEDHILLLDSTKSKEQLGWQPCLSLTETLCWTAEWYREYRRKEPLEICRRQIHQFEELCDVRL